MNGKETAAYKENGMYRKSAIVVIIAVMALMAVSFETAFALSGKNGTADPEQTVSTEHALRVNPVYEGVITESDLKQDLEESTGKEPGSSPALQSEPDYSDYETDEQVIIEQLRARLEARDTAFDLYFRSDYYFDCNEMIPEWFERAQYETDSPVAGDYLRYVIEGWGSEAAITYDEGSYYTRISLNVGYYTTYEQEQELTAEFDKVMQNFGFTAATSDYEKIRTIYDYICSNVTYDYEHLYDNDYKLKYTAYAALMNKTAVCQGYSVLLYRMLRTAGISTRVINGVGNGGRHAWNIAALGGVYYDLDSTWDAECSIYTYFLRGSSTFDDHYSDDQFLTDEFKAAYPISYEDYKEDQPEPPDTEIVEIDGFRFAIIGKQAVLLEYTGSGSDVTVPAEVNGKPVVMIDYHAFDGADTIKTLTLSEGIAELYTESIYNMKNLKELNLPSTLRMPDMSPDSNGIVPAMSPVPCLCPALEKVSVPESSPYLKSVDGVLFSKDMTTLFYYPQGRKAEEYTIPDGVVIIGSSAFENNGNIRAVRMSDTVEYIGYFAFSNARNLQEIDISESAKVFAQHALTGTAVKKIYLPASVELFNVWNAVLPELREWEVAQGSRTYSAADGVLFDKDKKELIHLPERKTGAYEIPDTVMSIRFDAAARTELSSITIPASAAVGTGNFIERPDGFMIYGYTGSSAEEYASQHGIAFTSIGTAVDEVVDSGTCGDSLKWTLSSTGVLRISGTGEMPGFPACEVSPWEDYRGAVRKVIIDEGVENVSLNAFNNFGAITEVVLPHSIRIIDTNAFICCEELMSIEIPDGVEEIGTAAFSSCDSLTGITIPASVRIMDQEPFAGCRSLKEIHVDRNNKVFKDVDGVLFSKDGKALVTYPAGKTGECIIPDTVEKIHHSAFMNSSAPTITIPDSVKEIGTWSFSGASARGIRIGSGITEIPDYAFYNCGVEKLVMGRNVKTIGNNAFYGYFTNLDTVYFSGTEAEWNNINVGYGNEHLLSCNVVFGKVSSFCDMGIHALECVPYKDNSCTEEGNLEYYACSSCGKFFGDPLGLTEMKKGAWVIPASGHFWDNGKVTKKPTYTEEGERTFTCETCGATRTETIDKLPEPEPEPEKITLKVKITAPKAGKKAITAKWKKVTEEDQQKIAGFQIQYSLKKNFKGAKTVKAGKTASSKKISKLKKKTVYYIRIRAYKGSRTGPWSAVKKVKTK